MPPTKEFKEMLSTLKDTGEREKYDQLFGEELGSAYSFLQGGTESVRATENASQSSSNPRIQEQTQSLAGDFNFRIPGNTNTGGFMPGAAPPKKTEAPIGLDPGRPDAVELPQVTVEKVEEGPASTTMQMDAVAPATAGTAETTDAVATTTGPVAKASVPQDVGASTMQAATVAALPEGQAAQGTISPEAIASVEEGTITSPAVAAQRDIASEQAAKAVAAQRPETKDYMTAITSDERYKVLEAQNPEVTTRIAQTISDREAKELKDIVTGEGVNLDDIPEFKLAEQRTAQVAEAKTRIAQDLGTAPSVDFEGRQAILGTAPVGDAAQIGGIPTLAAAQMQAVTGQARKTAAADMNAVVGNIPPAITATILDDPQAVEAQLDTEPVNVKVAIAALPTEALVSTQMEGLLSELEDNKTPVWARPAVDAVNQMMAARGLTASTVGRDALFNAIIQSALPIAQSNAQALQQRASQNLSNEQQSGLQEASQVMQQRLSNLANRQTAASQTAQMAQEINVRQGEFEQQATLTTAQQAQDVRMQNLQNAQQKASQESSQQQQAALANLDAGTRTDLANLEALNQAGAQNLNAEQQTRLAEYNAKVNRTMRQAELQQDMEKANLSTALQVELTNLTEQNAASRDTMTATNQKRLNKSSNACRFQKD
jgi:hypothetical protein